MISLNWSFYQSGMILLEKNVIMNMQIVNRGEVRALGRPFKKLNVRLLHLFQNHFSWGQSLYHLTRNHFSRRHFACQASLKVSIWLLSWSSLSQSVVKKNSFSVDSDAGVPLASSSWKGWALVVFLNILTNFLSYEGDCLAPLPNLWHGGTPK